MKLKVLRYDPASDVRRFDIFQLEAEPGMTVLDALFRIQQDHDDSLSFRYSCRGAICGSCAMLINKIPRLACRTQIKRLLDGSGQIELKPYPAIAGGEPYDQDEEIIVEPLPHLPLIKDLVVDMEPFFEAYRLVEPYLKPKPAGSKEYRMKPEEVTRLELYTNCILCATCYGSCPVNAKESSYIGPAALAKLYRFYLDPREEDHEARLLLGNRKEGWWGCEFHTNCMKVCPKGVPPNRAIGQARVQLEKLGKRPEEATGEEDSDGKD